MTHHASEVRERYYRAYLIKDKHIVGYENVLSHDDDAAIEKAREILKASKFLTIEVWRGNECLASVAKHDALSIDRTDVR
ncbi:MAG: hypothetical protein C0484_19200 [Rhodospirillum sp.]|nr:hypothetical protein [Rhodospirillum sp.]